MEQEIVYDINHIDKEEWRTFVLNHPKGNVFQTLEIYACYENTTNASPSLLAVKENKQIKGVLLYILLKEDGLLKGYFSTRSIIIGGPLATNDDKDIVRRLLEAYDKQIASKAIYTQIRNLNEQLNNCDIFREQGYKFESHLNFIISLDTEDKVWNRIGKGRIKQIRKAQKNNLKVQVIEADKISDELLRECYEIITEVYNRANLPLISIKVMQEAVVQRLLVLFIVYNDKGKILGCRMGLRFRDNMYGWYAGSKSMYYNLYPNDLLIWETLRWCLANGFKTFDYGGAGSPNKPYGVRNFKAQMGGKLVNYGRFEKIHKPLRMKLALLGYKVYQKLFKFNKS